jgi:hypothetical protein
MGKLGALTILVALAAIIYFFSPGSQIKVSESIPADANIEQPDSIENKQTTSSATDHPDHILKNSNETPHSHELSVTDTPVEIPQFIKDSLEAKRIPASELVEQHHPDGSVSIDLKGQFQHVPVAVIGKDGKMRIIEKTIEPIAEQ